MTELQPRRGEIVEPRAGAPQVLGRLASLAAGLRRAVLKLALAGTAAAAAIGYALFRHGFPDRTGAAVLSVIAIAAAVTPPAILTAFWFLLSELLQLPGRIRTLPMDARGHAEQLGQLARETRERRGRWTHLPGQLWRLTRLTSSSRELLTPYAPIVPLLSLPFLAAVVVAAGAVVAEIAIALVVVLVLLVT